MRIGGVITELNPFHNGHAYLCRTLRERGITHLVAVMSGNFVQRGDFAITEKRVRAACALSSGFDLVIELPVAWSVATAQAFARGGTGLLAGCSCLDALCFGSECGDSTILEELASVLEEEAVEERLRELLAQGITYAKARQLAVEAVCGRQLASHLASPNDLLGLEYLRQAKALHWHPSIVTVPRMGAAHDSRCPNRQIASASFLRSRSSLSAVSRYLPPACRHILEAAQNDGLYPVRMETLEKAILARLRALSRQELANLPDLSEGLENRLFQGIQGASSLEELALAVKTKRYPMARIRRLILSAFLGIQQEDGAGLPPYLHILGFNRRGQEILAAMGKAATLPVDTSLARLGRRDRRCSNTARLESASTDLYTLALPQPLPCGYDLTAPVVKWKEEE